MLATCTASKTSMMMVSHYHNAEHAVRRLCFALTRRVYHRYNQHGRSSLWVGHVICSDSTTNTKYVWTILPFQALDSHCKTRNTYCTVIPKSALKGRLRLSSASNFMTQVQTIGGLKQRRGRGRGRGTGRGRGGRSRRNDKPEPFRPFKGPAKSLSVDSSQQPPAVSHGSGVFATEQQHLAGVAKLQQQHDEAIALRAVQMAELQKQQQAQQAQACFSSRSEALGTSAPSQPPATSSAERDIIDLCDDTGQPPHQALGVPARPPAKPREQISWSLGVGHATSDSSVPSGSSNGDNPFWAPARYMPVGGETQADLRLQTQEVVQVLDSGLVGHRGTAILDTGTCLMLHSESHLLVS